MAYIAGVSGGIEFQEEKSADITPSANWSGTYTNYSEINPDTGYDAMEKVKVRTPMLRDYTLMNVSQVDTPGTVYDGNTSRSNSAKMLRVAPSKDGMSYTNSYLEVPAHSAMGDATAADVASGKTFSSGNGIALTGTAKMSEDMPNNTIFNVRGRVNYHGDNMLTILPPQEGIVYPSDPNQNRYYYVPKDSRMGDATAADVLASKTFSSGSGIYQTGTIQTRSASSETISAAKTYDAGYYPNGWTVTPQGGSQDFYKEQKYSGDSEVEIWFLSESVGVGTYRVHPTQQAPSFMIPLPSSISQLSQIKRLYISIMVIGNYSTASGAAVACSFSSDLSWDYYYRTLSSSDTGGRGTVLKNSTDVTSSNRLGIKVSTSVNTSSIPTGHALIVSYYQGAYGENKGLYAQGIAYFV